MVDLLDSPNKEVKRDACVTVGILRTHEAQPKLQTIFQTDSDVKNKAAAMQGLAYLGDKVSVPVFTAALVEQIRTFVRRRRRDWRAPRIPKVWARSRRH